MLLSDFSFFLLLLSYLLYSYLLKEIIRFNTKMTKA
nr:MAG TPA: hypothetical protein [Caudoviricetes sp.]